MDDTELSKLTAGQLNEMVGNGRAIIKSVMTGQWEIVIDGESKGTVLTDTFKDETTVTLGERVIGKFTNR